MSITGNIAATEEGSDTLAATAISRTNYALQYQRGAASLARRVHQIERENAGRAIGPFFDELMYLVPSAVMLSAACLEAFANELFADGVLRFPGATPQAIERAWKQTGSSILRKYHSAVELAGFPPLDQGRSPYQDVAVLVELRNHLVHFKPEWTNAPLKHKDLSDKLALHIVGSPFFAATEPLFPRGFLSHSCCVWAVKSVAAFLTEFQTVMKMEIKIDARDPQLAASQITAPGAPISP